MSHKDIWFNGFIWEDAAHVPKSCYHVLSLCFFGCLAQMCIWYRLCLWDHTAYTHIRNTAGSAQMSESLADRREYQCPGLKPWVRAVLIASACTTSGTKKPAWVYSWCLWLCCFFTLLTKCCPNTHSRLTSSTWGGYTIVFHCKSCTASWRRMQMLEAGMDHMEVPGVTQLFLRRMIWVECTSLVEVKTAAGSGFMSCSGC